MSKQAVHVGQYSFTGKESLLFDANVWIFLFSPYRAKGGRKESDYSAGLKRIQSAGSRIFIDVLILSEFINSSTRINYRKISNQGQFSDFKAFRKSTAFQPEAQQIVSACRKILALCDLTESGFADSNISSLLKDFETGARDFNDHVLEGLCRQRGFILVTDDADFKNSSVTLLTANPKLLNP